MQKLVWSSILLNFLRFPPVSYLHDGSVAAVSWGLHESSHPEEWGHYEAKLNQLQKCSIEEKLTYIKFRELREHLLCVCAVATRPAASTTSHYAKSDANLCWASGHRILTVSGMFLPGCRRSPATNQPTLTKVCLSGESCPKRCISIALFLCNSFLHFKKSKVKSCFWRIRKMLKNECRRADVNP